MKTTKGRDRAIRIAFGIGGFVVLVGGTPCVLAMLDVARAGPDDPVGMFGVVGLAAFVLFVGITLLYQAFKRDNS